MIGNLPTRAARTVSRTLTMGALVLIVGDPVDGAVGVAGVFGMFGDDDSGIWSIKGEDAYPGRDIVVHGITRGNPLGF